MIAEKQKTNTDLITPPREQWHAPVKTSFKLTVSVQQVALPDAKIMSFQKKVEEIAVKMFSGGVIRYTVE